MVSELDDSPLGKKIDYTVSNGYNPKLLFPIPRETKRLEIGIDNNKLPFVGIDIWNHYEVSWLDMNGKPHVAVAILEILANSPYILESKSLKLYFNSLNNHKFLNFDVVRKTIADDLSAVVKEHVNVEILPLITDQLALHQPSGICVDNIDTNITEYVVNPQLLKTINTQVKNEEIYSNLLRSNCLITNQPDWATVMIKYSGNKIDHESFLKYIVSFRNHNEFHEQCIERIFIDIMNQCDVNELTVIGRFTRRGGIDINPIRSTDKNVTMKNSRLIRQ